MDSGDITPESLVKIPTPEDATYGGHEITEVTFSGSRLAIVYEGEDLLDGWDQLMFGATADDGTISVTRAPPSLVHPERARTEETPGANEAEQIYDMLEDSGIELEIDE